tara:strand:- start:753 stop:1496 length:744 start_codon:yes stop_codon:yes gene_type:complete
MSEVKTNKISSVSTNGDITLDPDGTGDVVVASGHKLGIGTTSPALPLEVNGSTNVAVFRSDASNSIIQLANSTGTGGDNGTLVGSVGDDLYFRAGDAERMRIDASGRVTMPNQPAFSVKPASNQTNLTADANVTVVMDSEIYDVGANFASNTFTAPVTGKYILSFILYGSQLAGDVSYMETAIETSNRTYVNIQEPSGSESVYAGTTVTAVADMDANDTANCRVTVGGSSSTFDIANVSIFSGALIC